MFLQMVKERIKMTLPKTIYLISAIIGLTTFILDISLAWTDLAKEIEHTFISFIWLGLGLTALFFTFFYCYNSYRKNKTI